MELEKLERGDLPIADKALMLCAQASRAEIGDMDTASRGADLMKLLNVALKNTDEQRKSWVGPLNETVKRINSGFKRITEPLKTAKDDLQGKLDVWMRAEQQRAEEEAAATLERTTSEAMETAKALQDAGYGDAAERIVDEAARGEDTVMRTTRAPAARGTTVGAIASPRSSWLFHVKQLDDVPRRFMKLDHVVVRQWMKDAQAVAEAQATGLRGNEKRAMIDRVMERILVSEGVTGLVFEKEVRAVVR